MAEPDIQTFRLSIGQAKTLVVTMDEAPSGGVAAWTMRFRLRRKGGAVLIEKTSGSGITVTDAVNGVWEIDIDEADSDDLKVGLPEWAFWRTDNGNESPVAYGTCTVYRTAETG